MIRYICDRHGGEIDITDPDAFKISSLNGGAAVQHWCGRCAREMFTLVKQVDRERASRAARTVSLPVLGPVHGPQPAPEVAPGRTPATDNGKRRRRGERNADTEVMPVAPLSFLRRRPGARPNE